VKLAAQRQKTTAQVKLLNEWNLVVVVERAVLYLANRLSSKRNFMLKCLGSVSTIFA